jgi:hypothetical protein
MVPSTSALMIALSILQIISNMHRPIMVRMIVKSSTKEGMRRKGYEYHLFCYLYMAED